MQRQDSYPYAPSSHSSSKFSSPNSTSSAFSASANPNEDWTKISDLAERRRIQNRIAQRNYRKKIKRRLEDLERRAGSSSISPEQSHAELVSVEQTRQNNENGIKRQRSKDERSARARRTSTDPPPAQYSRTTVDRSLMFDHRYQRDASASPPPTFTYSYPLPDPLIHAPYPQHSLYHSLPSPYSDNPNQQMYLPPLPVTLPSMSPYELGSSKNDSLFESDDMLSQFNMSYAPMTSMDISTSQHYQESDPNTPPLLHSHSFEYSRAGSPSMIYPGTPSSIPDSPHIVIR